MAETFIPAFKSSPALQAGLYYARKNRRLRLAEQIANDIYYVASTPNPDAQGGTDQNGPGGNA